MELLKAGSVLLDKINSADHLSPGFCDGLAGWGWLMVYLKEQNLLPDFDDTLLEDVDEVLSASLTSMLQENNYDLFYGAIGLGLYFLKRRQFGMVKKILYGLADSAVTDEQEIKWVQHSPVLSKDARYDLGLPHGITGILYFINKCYRENVLPGLCEALLIKGTRFFLNNIQPEEKIQSFFPYWIKTDQYGDKENTAQRARLAWCYGDLNILYTLLQLSRSIKDPVLENAVIKMLLKTCERKKQEETDIAEAGFCHGAGGVSYLYLKLFKQTNIPLFRETADFWYHYTYGLGNQNGPAGYLFCLDEKYWGPASGILEGLGGVALSFLAYLHSDLTDSWDECLFLS
jgi:lantibiotic modifying enzyme